MEVMESNQGEALNRLAAVRAANKCGAVRTHQKLRGIRTVSPSLEVRPGTPDPQPTSHAQGVELNLRRLFSARHLTHHHRTTSCRPAEISIAQCRSEASDPRSHRFNIPRSLSLRAAVSGFDFSAVSRPQEERWWTGGSVIAIVQALSRLSSRPPPPRSDCASLAKRTGLLNPYRHFLCSAGSERQTLNKVFFVPAPQPSRQ